MSATENAQVIAEQPKQEGFRVYVGNLAFSTSEEKVREHIASAGSVASSIVFPRKFGSRPAGYAFAQYEKEEDAKKVVDKLNDVELDGRKLRVEIARPEADADERKAKRDAANAARKAKRAEAKAAQAPAPAPADAEAKPEAAADGEQVKKPRKKSKRGGRRRQPAEEGEEGADASDDAKPAGEPKGRIDGGNAEGEAKPKKERKPRQKKLAPSGAASKDTLFVSNLPYELDDDALSSIFTNLSISVKSATILRSTFRPRKGAEEGPRRSRGFGFVVVENPAQLSEAVDKASGTLIANRSINVKVANEMEPVEKAQVDEAKVEGTPDKPAA